MRVFLVLLLIAGAACARSEPGSRSTPRASGVGASPDPTAPSASVSAKPGTTAGPRGTGSASAAAKPTVAPKGSVSGREVARAPEGRTNLPAPGSYVYDVSGTRTSGGRRSPAAEKERTITVSQHRTGDTFTEIPIRNGDSGPTTNTLWGPESVMLRQMFAEASDGRFECNFSPPLTYLKLPIEKSDYAKETYADVQCSGGQEVKVLGPSETSAAGRTWRVWRIRRVFDLKVAPLAVELHTDTVHFYSPDVGADVRMEVDGRYTAGTDSGSTDTTLVLRSWP